MSNSSSQRLARFGTLALAVGLATGTVPAAEKQVPLAFSGGHQIGKNDFGRPVPLIAATLGVKPDEFRKAFSGVTPAKGGKPTGEEARRNKEALKPAGVVPIVCDDRARGALPLAP